MKLLSRRRRPAVPDTVPEGMSHVEYVAFEAVAAMDRGDHNTAQINFGHAIYVALTKRELDETEARALFGVIADGCWRTGA